MTYTFRPKLNPTSFHLNNLFFYQQVWDFSLSLKIATSLIYHWSEIQLKNALLYKGCSFCVHKKDLQQWFDQALSIPFIPLYCGSSENKKIHFTEKLQYFVNFYIWFPKCVKLNTIEFDWILADKSLPK